MEYSYIHERQENRSNPETGQGPSQNQHPLHYQHQHYTPTHHAAPASYPGLRFTPYLNALQVPGQPHGSEGIPHSPRIPTSSRPSNSRGSPGQRSQDYEHVVTAAMQVNTSSLHYRPDLSTNSLQLQQVPVSIATSVASSPVQQPSTVRSAPDTSYHIQDLSLATQNSVAATQNASQADATHRSDSISSVSLTPTTGVNKKKGPPRGRAKRESQPVVQIVEPQIQHQRPKEYTPTYTKCCQTEPMFDEIWKPNDEIPEKSNLPAGMVFIESGNEKNKVCGVMATEDLKEGEEFGPYTGEFVKEGLGCFNPSTWEICVRGRPRFYIDGATDPNNWMQHVQYARNTNEQNMEAFQVYGDIFFRLTKPVKAGKELRVFYSQQYSTKVGFKTRLDELHLDQDSQMFECQDCKCRYTNAKSLLRHLKFEHDKENQRDHDTNMDIQSDILTSPRLEEISSFRKKMAASSSKTTIETPAAEVEPDSIVKEDKKKFCFRVKLVPLKIEGKKDEAGASSSCQSKKKDSVKRFSCKKCGKLFPSQGHLKEHAAFHQETKDIKPICKICGLECKHGRALKQHMISHDSGAFQCPKCNKFFRRKGCFVYHLRHVHETFVGARWMRGSMEDKMMRYVGPEEETEDPEPFHPELPKDMLGKRILTSCKKPKVFKCKYCPQKFSAHSQVYRHEMTVHTNTGKYKCDFCPLTFNEKTRFIIHRRKHTLDRPFKCEECPRSFSSESALKNHLPEHRGERPYQCDVCGKGFRTRKYMTTHKRRMHMAQTVFLKCSFCDKTFKHKTALGRHEKCHKGIRPHVCMTCGRAFGTKYSLQSHMHVHTGEKPFECRVCNQKFALSHHLSTHMISHEH